MSACSPVFKLFGSYRICPSTWFTELFEGMYAYRNCRHRGIMNHWLYLPYMIIVRVQEHVRFHAVFLEPAISCLSSPRLSSCKRCLKRTAERVRHFRNSPYRVLTDKVVHHKLLSSSVSSNSLPVITHQQTG